MENGAKKSFSKQKLVQSECETTQSHLLRDTETEIHRASRLGIWKNGLDGETPAEYKRRHAQAEATPVSKGDKSKIKTTTTPSSSPPRSFLNKLRFW